MAGVAIAMCEAGLPCRCRRFKNFTVKNEDELNVRSEAIETALSHEYDQCFSVRWAVKYPSIIFRCKDFAVSVALSTIMPIIQSAVFATLQESHAVRDAIAYTFCKYLEDTWFAIDNLHLSATRQRLACTHQTKVKALQRTKRTRGAMEDPSTLEL